MPFEPADPLAAGWPEKRDLRLPIQWEDNQAITIFDYASRAYIGGYQYRRIASMISHARANSAWWAEHLKGVADSGELSWADLPLMDRGRFREAAAAGAVPTPLNHGPVRSGTTSGSSGIPMAFHVTGLFARLNRHHHNCDLYRQGFDVDRAFASIEPSRRSGTASGPLRRSTPSFPRDAKAFTVEQHARWLAKIAPAYLTTLPTLLNGIVEAYEAGVAEPPRIDKVITYAETLHADVRRRARAVLGARIVDRYSTEETGPVAFQCPVHDDLHHVVVTNVLVEILTESGEPAPEGEIGRVFVTSLNNWASPALRYELGDLAAWRRSCPCGFQGMTLERMLGRTRFLIRLPNGERTYVGLPAKAWMAVAPIREKRIIQTEPGLIRAEVVLDRPLSADEATGLSAMLAREIHRDIRYEIVQVDRIDWGPTYKRQDVVSLI
jgi:phenylacetate-CoA ligase